MPDGPQIPGTCAPGYLPATELSFSGRQYRTIRYSERLCPRHSTPLAERPRNSHNPSNFHYPGHTAVNCARFVFISGAGRIRLNVVVGEWFTPSAMFFRRYEKKVEAEDRKLRDRTQAHHALRSGPQRLGDSEPPVSSRDRRALSEPHLLIT